jgi:hypothetical protein
MLPALGVEGADAARAQRDGRGKEEEEEEEEEWDDEEEEEEEEDDASES